jgi:hypothetical protein
MLLNVTILPLFYKKTNFTGRLGSRWIRKGKTNGGRRNRDAKPRSEETSKRDRFNFTIASGLSNRGKG